MRFTIDQQDSGGFVVSSPDLPDWSVPSHGGPQLVEAVMTGMRVLLRRTGSTAAAAAWAAPSTGALSPSPSPSPGPVDVLDLPLSLLFADPAYQRPLDRRRVTKMAADFDPDLIGVLEVSARTDGRFAIVDGQHRWALLLDLADDGTDPAVACKVHRDLSGDDEAALFFDIDASRRRLTGWDRWCARRGAGDPVVLDVEQTLRACGLRTGATPVRGVVRSTGACEMVHDLGGPGLLAECCQLVLNVWDDDPDALTAQVIGGFAYLLTAYPDDLLDRGRLIACLQPRTLRQLASLIATKRERTPGQAPRLAAAVMVDLYNQADRAGRLDGTVLRELALSRPRGPDAPAAASRACGDCGVGLVKKHRAGRWPVYCTPCRNIRRGAA